MECLKISNQISKMSFYYISKANSIKIYFEHNKYRNLQWAWLLWHDCDHHDMIVDKKKLERN